MNKMFLLLTVFAMSILSCNKDGNDATDPYQDAPRSNLPDEISPAYWRYGGVSALGVYDDRANHVANAQDALREYKVTKDGFVEFVQYLATSDGVCYNMTYTHLKGTMKYEAPNKITWTPVEGEFYKKFPCQHSDDTRKANKADLERIKSVYWYKWDDFGVGGKQYLVLFTDPSMLPQYQAFAYDVIR